MGAGRRIFVKALFLAIAILIAIQMTGEWEKAVVNGDYGNPDFDRMDYDAGAIALFIFLEFAGMFSLGVAMSRIA